MEKGADPISPPANKPQHLYYCCITLIMGLMGSFFWAIRGTSGYGGSQGGLLAGAGWALLWYYFAHMGGWGAVRPYASPRILAAITFGIAFGGLTGYGVYIAWLQGKYYLDYPNTVRAIAPWTGYAMLFLCGLHWGGITGAFMAWCAPHRPVPRKGWIVRILLGITGAIAAGMIVYHLPQWFLPFYGEGLYDVMENRTCIRAMGSIQNIAPHLGLFLGFLVFEIGRRDWRAVGMMTVMSLGFAVPFTVGGYWHTMQGSALQIDWWKNWEMSIGLGGGLSFGLAFLLFNRPESKAPPREISPMEKILGGAVPLSLAGCSIVMNACKGFVDIHALNVPTWEGRVASIFCALLFVLLLVYWSFRIRQGTDAGRISTFAFVAVLVLIILAGYLVSIPFPLRLANKVLLTCYTVSVGVSLILFRFSRKNVISRDTFGPRDSP